MGFYHGSGEPSGGDPGGWKETFQIILIVFRVLAIPLAILIGAILALFGLFWLFTIHVLAGFGVIALIIAAIVARGIWEAKHPPEIR
jgi:hypothetical protein